MHCPKCQHANPPRARSCIDCGAPLAQTCAGCGSELPAGARFCPQCACPVAPVVEREGIAQATLPRHLATRILESRAALEGERKQVTVLFADMKGSTELLADRDPEEARQILDPVLQRLMDAVHHYEGTVNQVMGDGIMALFGAPLALEDHALRACYAALRLQEAVRQYADQARRQHGIEVQVRVGLNSGEVVVRSIGSDLRMDYTAVGQTTHLAARMEQLATPGSIRLTAATLALVEGFVEVKPLGPIPVKGIAEPVHAFELLGAAAARTRLQAQRARGLTRFVGRDVELEQLRRAADEAKRAHGQIVAVVGEPGVGKSRLYFEFTHSRHLQGWRVVEAGSVSYGKATALLPLADMLRAYFHIDSRDDPRTVRSKVTGQVLTLDEGLRDAVPAALWLLDALPADNPFAAIDAAERRRLTLAALKRLLLRESQVQPLLLVFEDLHWIDSETQAFLDSLAESVPAAAVLLAVNYRPEYRHGWAGKTYYRQLRIDPLALESSEHLLHELLGDDASLTSLKKLLADRTEGNPLYIEESVRALVETGALAGARGMYRLVGDLSAVRIPASVQAILAARVDRLPPEDKRLLQAAAVVGKDVPYALLREIAELSEDELRGGLGRLQAAEFIYEGRLFPDLEYTFKHALTHEIAYGGVLHERRRALHVAIVDAIERLLGADRLIEQVERLAHHAVHAEDGLKAVHYLRLAGQKAAARSANREAAACFEQALALQGTLPETLESLRDALDIRMALGPVLMTLKGASHPDVESFFNQTHELLERLHDTRHRFQVLWAKWRIAYSSGRYAEALERGEELLEAARHDADSGQLLEAHHAMWPVLIAMGRTQEALVHVERGVALYDRERHAALVVYSGHDAGACCRFVGALARWIGGYPEQALIAVKDATRLAEQLQHPLTITITAYFAAVVHLMRGEHQAANAWAQRVIALCDTHTFADWAEAAQVIACATSDDAPSLVRLAELQQIAPRATAWRRTYSLCLLAGLYAACARPDLGSNALGMIGTTERDGLFAPEIERIEGELWLRQPEPGFAQAERHFGRAIEIAHQRDARSFELRAAIGLARSLESVGRGGAARAALSGVYERFTEGFDTLDLRAARGLLDRLQA